jgi:hypothetical protein
MAVFGTKKKVSLHDEYMTPFSAWDNIKHLLPKDKVLWEAFYGNGQSLNNLRRLGFIVEGGEGEDFFQHNKGDIVVSNPPFSSIPLVLERLVALDKPFVLIMPVGKLNTQAFRALFATHHIQIIIPRKRIQFQKVVDGKEVETSGCAFDCLYYCYGLGLERDIHFLQ